MTVDVERDLGTTDQELADLRMILERARRLSRSPEPQVRGGMTRIVVIATTILRNCDPDFFEKALEWEGPPAAPGLKA